jgi:ribonuclease HI
MSGADNKTTNNRMELQAVIEGLGQLSEKSIVSLYSDSKYVVNGINAWMYKWKAKGWRKVMNLDLWQELDALCGTHHVNANWVRGHSGHPENEECDRMSMEACADATQSVQPLLHPK